MRKKITFLFFMFSFFFAFSQDGTLDTTFNTGTTLSTVGSLGETAIYSNNDVICVGRFKVNGVDHTIAKFNSAGALITSYPLTDVFSSSILGAIRSVVIQPDNKIIISGVFNKYSNITNFSNGNAIRGLIRINADGTLDQTFAPDLSFLAPIATATTLNSGKILLNPAGDVYVFYPIPTQANGNYSNQSILKLSSAGVVDTTFKNNAPVLISQAFLDMKFQSNGKIVAVGNFTQDFGGTTYDAILRVNTNGTVDSTFSNSTALSYTTTYITPLTYGGYIGEVEIFNDDAIFISGVFDHANGNPANTYAKLTSNGVYDAAYNSNTNFGTFNPDYSNSNSWSYNVNRPIKMQPDGKVLMAFRDYANAKAKVIRLNQDGTLDNCFYSGVFSYGTSNLTTSIFDLKLYPDNRILIFGFLNKFDAKSANFLVRLKNKIDKLAANNDTFDFNGCVTATTGAVLANDTFNGALITSPSGYNITAGVVSPLPATGGIQLNSNGTVTVLAGTPAATYTIPYQISTIGSCPIYSNTGFVTVNVTSSSTIQPIGIDNAWVGVIQGTTSTQSVLSAVTIGGVPATSSDVVISLFSGTEVPGITINADGTVTVASNVSNGNYSIGYKVCQYCQSSNCSEYRKIYVTVGLIAKTDAIYFDSNGNYINGNLNVFTNDVYGQASLNPSSVSITYDTTNPYFTINTVQGSPSYGNITFNTGLPAGWFDYQYNYTICLLANPSNCSTGVIELWGESAGKFSDTKATEKSSVDTVTVFPNPSSGVFNIQMDGGFAEVKDFQIEVFTVLGQKIMTKEYSKNNPQIDLSNFENGTYFLKTQTGEKIINKMIVKK